VGLCLLKFILTIISCFAALKWLLPVAMLIGIFLDRNRQFNAKINFLDKFIDWGSPIRGGIDFKFKKVSSVKSVGVKLALLRVNEGFDSDHRKSYEYEISEQLIRFDEYFTDAHWFWIGFSFLPPENFPTEFWNDSPWIGGTKVYWVVSVVVDGRLRRVGSARIPLNGIGGTRQHKSSTWL
jgi:hypothetical protein